MKLGVGRWMFVGFKKLQMTNDSTIIIKKASGDEEPFSSEKLERSLINAGAKSETIESIIEDINTWIFNGVTTKQIYRKAFSMLRRKQKSAGNRYKLKQAILEIGPTGYPFETLIGEVFKKQGYSTEVGIVVEGGCITHEMDVIATRGKDQHLVECKYHKDQGKQVSIQVPLYVKSRVEDIAQTRRKLPAFADFYFHTWVVTNTRFSSDSIDYSRCNGLNLLAWDYPAGKGLKDMIEKYSLYPLTILHNLTMKEKHALMEQGIVTCTQLSAKPESLEALNLTQRKYNAVKRELEDICME